MTKTHIQVIKKIQVGVEGFVAGSRKVLATAVDDWLENLLALAPVRAYVYVQKYHNL